MEFLFSVFTPTYNRANTIGRTYEYLCKQTLRSFAVSYTHLTLPTT